MLINSLSALSPENWPFEAKMLPQNVYLVGGSVRDALLKRKTTYLDLDFIILDQAVSIARNIAKEYQAGFVVLDAERKIARVVFKGTTVDFAEIEGNSLKEDLWRRDFTINAIAYNPFTNELIDLFNALKDLQDGIIRMVKSENLKEDPLRLLRAYRQAAQLGFIISPETQTTIREFAPLITQVATERVQTELGYLLSHPQGMIWIEKAWKNGLLSDYFPAATENLGIGKKVEIVVEKLQKNWSTLKVELGSGVRNTVKTSLLAIAKLAILVNSNPQKAEVELMRLKYSNAEIRSTIAVLKSLEKLSEIEVLHMSVREQYFFFQQIGKNFPALAVVAVAKGISMEEINCLIERYINPDDLVAHPTTLLSGNDLITALKLPKGPIVGQLLTEIQIARAEENILTQDEAIKLAQKLIAFRNDPSSF
ncbi:Polynucleotide adenylyltransferase region [Trichodesmium erythraeum IMS101]|mgnify:CR=1 FL=1|uniref:Polynucleotide adenylyltransferase region n=1 Tax=Trichodesmium erythraeum (strain IMS101) TaxID=203124 RepID=Q116Z1_TRIEI|nr:CCA tRNA nucleotidyltransferase [Trichodesmium erythraeum GBRTRLIN201]MCH2048674.1 CCA tRNA nucleotidyltransferase [Trichodesmium sp. ALOHA_ZT_67]MDE5093207.1 CCA tRNA nucleotidyltransferase [Trichodesmium sp. St11_bin5]MDT9338369.1 CCA tRNA nucleotidyltransferase [Trichodesmium erythraeum 21-75]